jgi:two-component system cell cycle response regulator
MSDALSWAIFGATVVALVVFAAFFVFGLRRERRGFEAAMNDMTDRMAEVVKELHAARETSHDDNQRARILGELAGTIDLDEVLARVLEAAGAVRGVDAALVTVASSAGEKPIVASVGLSTEEAEMAVAGPPDGRVARAVTVAYEYPPEIDSNGADLIRHGVAVPIPGEVTALGHLVVFSRAPAHAFAESDKRSLEDLASRAGPAIENARRFREARQLADLDALTGLHNRRYFHETLAREVARAHRYGRKLALVVFDLDDFKAINDRIGHLAGDGVLAEVAERVRSVVRSADIACRVGGDEFGIILPESTIADAEQLSHRMQGAVAARPIGDAGTLQLSAGAAELQTEDDATRFFERADDALYRAKESGKAEVVAAGGSETPPSAGGEDRAIGPLG